MKKWVLAGMCMMMAAVCGCGQEQAEELEKAGFTEYLERNG